MTTMTIKCDLPKKKKINWKNDILISIFLKEAVQKLYRPLSIDKYEK